MRTGELVILGTAFTAAVMGACFYPYLPEQIAAHWNGEGQVDGYMPKFWGVFLMPLALVVLAALFAVIVRIDPRKGNIEEFRKYSDGLLILLSVFFFCVQLQVLLWNVGFRISPNVTFPVWICILFYYIGILCERVRRNWLVGIRTPWTLRSDRVWEATNQRAAKLLKAAGVIALLGVVFWRYALWFILVPVIAVVVYSVVYSYVEYRRQTPEKQEEAAGS